MPRFFTDELLRRLRNDVAFERLFARLDWPHKQRDGQLAFVCPKCGVLRLSLADRNGQRNSHFR